MVLLDPPLTRLLIFIPYLGSGAISPYCTVSSTHDEPWWLVDLTTERVITRVEVQTRTDCCCKLLIFCWICCWTEVHFVGPSFWTLVDSTNEFQSQGGSVISYALFSLVPNDLQSNLWLLGPGTEPESLTYEGSSIQLRQPGPA